MQPRNPVSIIPTATLCPGISNGSQGLRQSLEEIEAKVRAKPVEIPKTLFTELCTAKALQGNGQTVHPTMIYIDVGQDIAKPKVWSNFKKENVEEAKDKPTITDQDYLATPIDIVKTHNQLRPHKIVALSEIGFSFATYVKGKELTEDRS
jgi:hypothetical protein